jgi:hypothetical protein
MSRCRKTDDKMTSVQARGGLRGALCAVLEANEHYMKVAASGEDDSDAWQRRYDAIDAAEAALRSNPVVYALLEIITARDRENDEPVSCWDLFERLDVARLYEVAYP